MLKKGLDEWWTKELRKELDAIVKSSYNRDYRLIYGGERPPSHISTTNGVKTKDSRKPGLK